MFSFCFWPFDWITIKALVGWQPTQDSQKWRLDLKRLVNFVENISLRYCSWQKWTPNWIKWDGIPWRFWHSMPLAAPVGPFIMLEALLKLRLRQEFLLHLSKFLSACYTSVRRWQKCWCAIAECLSPGVLLWTSSWWLSKEQNQLTHPQERDITEARDMHVATLHPGQSTLSV